MSNISIRKQVEINKTETTLMPYSDTDSDEYASPEYIPADAEPFDDPDTSTSKYALINSLWITDDAVFSTGIHCRECTCDVMRIARESGEVSCPACGWLPAD